MKMRLLTAVGVLAIFLSPQAFAKKSKDTGKTSKSEKKKKNKKKKSAAVGSVTAVRQV